MKKLSPIAIEPSQKMGDVIHICWMLHNLCNHRCSYCNKENYNGDMKRLDYDNVITFLDKIFSHYKKDMYHVSFTGGEPTLWPEFSKLCRYLKEKNCEIGLTSNATKASTFWQDLSPFLNWTCLSYHPEFTKDDHFLKVVQILMNQTHLAVRLMMHKEKKYWDRSIAMGEKIKQILDCTSLFVEYVPLQENFGHDSRPVVYTPWQQEFFKMQTFFTVSSVTDWSLPKPVRPRVVWDYETIMDDGTRTECRPNELVARNSVNFEKWLCHAGVDSLFIDHRGEIYRAGCQQGGLVGVIFDKDLKFPTAPIVCKKNFCPCGTDIQIKKFKNPPTPHRQPSTAHRVESHRA